MGIASGRFVPTAAYASIQPFSIKRREHWVSIPVLTVCVASGVPIECNRGVQIIDSSPELGEAGIAIHLNGVTNPPYGELFPHHVEAFKKQFG